MAKKWIQGVTKQMKKKGTEGAFTASAKSGESTAQHISRVLAPESKASTKEKRRASFAKAMRSFDEGGMVHETGPAMLHAGEIVIPADEHCERYEVDRIPSPAVEGEMKSGTVKKLREKQLGSNRYLAN